MMQTTVPVSSSLAIRVATVAEPPLLIPAKTPGEEAQPLIEQTLALRENVVFEGSTILCSGPKPENEGEDPKAYGCPENPRDLTGTLAGKVAAGPISSANSSPRACNISGSARVG